MLAVPVAAMLTFAATPSLLILIVALHCWSLDHVFHDSAFTVAQLQRLPSIDCDRSPVLAALQLEAAADQAGPEADRDRSRGH